MSCSEDVNFDAFARDLQSFFTELESLNSSLVLTADPSAGALQYPSTRTGI
jgi:aarF domain-containing kinase